MLLRMVFAFVCAVSVLLPGSANAHRFWMLPSATILSGDTPYVTVDAAVSNDLFYFEHQPMRLDGLKITAPDGSTVAAENISSGKFRTTFDVGLKMPGTYRLAIVGDGVFARYKLKGETKRWRGRAEDAEKAIPAGAEDVRLTYSQRRLETFITAGKPSNAALKLVGKGLELEPLTHPNDLVAGSEAKFRFVMDGKAAAGAKVTIIRGGGRYRNDLGEVNVSTAADGTFAMKWPAPGMYWVSATVSEDKKDAKGTTRHRATYAATFEVMPE
ncbi:MAG: DUF4198 domain-containing protein [Hyphomicrobiaceae bacterium]